MQAIALGLITVATPGTPVQVCSDPTVLVSQLMIRTVPGFTGRTYLGTSALNKATNAGLIRVLSEPSASGPQDGEVIPAGGSGRGNVIRASDYWVDADVAGEGVLVTGFIA